MKAGSAASKNHMNLYYYQPETQQEHIALLRSLNLNEKVISKQEEDKF